MYLILFFFLNVRFKLLPFRWYSLKPLARSTFMTRFSIRCNKTIGFFQRIFEFCFGYPTITKKRIIRIFDCLHQCLILAVCDPCRFDDVLSIIRNVPSSNLNTALWEYSYCPKSNGRVAFVCNSDACIVVHTDYINLRCKDDNTRRCDCGRLFTRDVLIVITRNRGSLWRFVNVQKSLFA